MGTRHLIAVVAGGKYRVAQYGQWDGYPEGQGVTVFQFCKDPKKLELLATKVLLCDEVTPDAFKAAWVACGASPDSEFVSMEVGEKFREKFPHLSRECGAGILELIASSSEGLALQMNQGFAGDSLFCEWAYVIDLDARRLEVFKGFNKEPLPAGARFSLERFAKESPGQKLEDRSQPNPHSGDRYYPVRELCWFRLDGPKQNDEHDMPDEKEEFLFAVNSEYRKLRPEDFEDEGPVEAEG